MHKKNLSDIKSLKNEREEAMLNSIQNKMCKHCILLGLILNTIYHEHIEHILKQNCDTMTGWDRLRKGE